MFGNPVVPLKARRSPRAVVNDMAVIEQVLRLATSPGFVLVGRFREEVYQRTTGDEVEKVTAEVDAAVHQLIESRWLEVGGTHQVRYGRYEGPARSVLVPCRSRKASYRWSALTNPWKAA
ncbi:hypothetical protein ABT324_11575 [Saccharopolyspora sp. NPDC000359]|uniref:hypothetical protein n=1 Tax=Saccharopolyspora sp. NPDC000359 TaxID=3154251 RepID=UPI0033225D58